MYTGIDKSGKLQGLLINRGRIPFEYKDSKMHHTEPDKESEVEGCIFYSEGACNWENKAPGKKSPVDDLKERKL